MLQTKSDTVNMTSAAGEIHGAPTDDRAISLRRGQLRLLGLLKQCTVRQQIHLPLFPVPPRTCWWLRQQRFPMKSLMGSHSGTEEALGTSQRSGGGDRASRNKHTYGLLKRMMRIASSAFRHSNQGGQAPLRALAADRAPSPAQEMRAGIQSGTMRVPTALSYPGATPL